MVMQKLGKDIGQYLRHCDYKFSLKTVAMLGMQMVSRLRSVHDGGIVHGDIKEDHFVMDEQCQTLYIIDFGLSTTYTNRYTKRHIKEEQDLRIRGTLPYASINLHRKIKSSRRDDIESLAYLLIRLLKGSLPWQSCQFCDRTYAETFDNVSRKKMTTGIADICAGLPTQLMDFMRYARRMRFADRPDYDYLRKLLRQALVGANLTDDGVYDWMINGSAGHV